MKKILLSLVFIQLICIQLFSKESSKTNPQNIKAVVCIANPTVSIGNNQNLICEGTSGKIQINAKFTLSDSSQIVKDNLAITWATDAQGNNPLLGFTKVDTKGFQILIDAPQTAGVYKYYIIITQAECPSANGNAVITVNAPITANAGNDSTGSETCGRNLITLKGNQPSGTSGKWSFVSSDSSNATITNPTNATTTFTGEKNKLYTLKWTLYQAPCAASSDNVDVFFNKEPGHATLSTSDDNYCETKGGKLTLKAKFSVIDSLQIIDNNLNILWSLNKTTFNTLPNSTLNDALGFSIDYTRPTSKTVVYVKVNQNICPSSKVIDSITISPVKYLGDANAGTDSVGSETCGKTSITLKGNQPSGTTGKWSFVSSDSSNAVITNTTSGTTPFSGEKNKLYILKWTLYQAPCPTTSDNVNVLFNKEPNHPTLSTTDDNYCENKGGTLTLKAKFNTEDSIQIIDNNINILWSLNKKTFSALPFSTLNDPNGFSVNYTRPNNKTIIYTKINQSICPNSQVIDSITINTIKLPTSSNAGNNINDATTCDKDTINLSANKPNVGNGKWSVVSSSDNNTSAIIFSNDTLNTSFISGGVKNTTYVLRWTISNNPCPLSSSDVTVKFNESPSNAVANDKNGCDVISLKLDATAPTKGIGKWTIKSGNNGGFSSDTDPKATFSGDKGAKYVLTWTVSSAPCTDKTIDINVAFNENPTKSSAGPDIVDKSTCGKNSISLAANNPTIGKGKWKVVSASDNDIISPTFQFDDSFDAIFKGKNGVSYVLAWDITNSPCGTSSDQMKVIFNQNPSEPIVSDITGTETCGDNQVLLRASAPSVGSGEWTIKKGNATLANKNQPNSLLTGVNGDTITLNWRVSNSPCDSKSKDATVIFQKNPEQPNVASTYLCDGKTASLTALITDKKDYKFQWYRDTLSMREGLDSLIVLYNDTNNVLQLNNQNVISNPTYFKVVVINQSNNCALADDSIKVALEGGYNPIFDYTFCNDKPNFDILRIAPLILNATNDTYTWKSISENKVIGTDDTVNITKVGDYSLEINHPRCGALGPYNFKVKSYPIAKFNLSSLDSICLSTSVEVTANLVFAGTPKYTYYWFQTDDTDTTLLRKDTLSMATLTPTRDTTTIYMTAVDGNGCYSTTSKKILAPDFDYTNQPNIFTPNGDHYNDNFKIRKAVKETKIAIEVYNRWGTQIYKSDDYKDDWDGNEASDGVYYYTMEPSCPKITVKKWVQIAR